MQPLAQVPTSCTRSGNFSIQLSIQRAMTTCSSWRRVSLRMIVACLGVEKTEADPRDTEQGVGYEQVRTACEPPAWVASLVMWRKRDGAFFRLVKCTTSRPPWQAATGGTRHGKGYQQVSPRA
jgi:hypothetical protein